MFKRLEEDMDINCGGIVEDNKSVTDVGQEIFDYLVAVASGKRNPETINPDFGTCRVSDKPNRPCPAWETQ